MPCEVPLAMRWGGCSLLCYMLFEGLPGCSFSQVSVPILALKVLSVSHTKGLISEFKDFLPFLDGKKSSNSQINLLSTKVVQ